MFPKFSAAVSTPEKPPLISVEISPKTRQILRAIAAQVRELAALLQPLHRPNFADENKTESLKHGRDERSKETRSSENYSAIVQEGFLWDRERDLNPKRLRSQKFLATDRAFKGNRVRGD